MNIKDKTYSKILLSIFVFAFIYITYFVIFSEFKKLLFVTPDDASYYLKIAQNFTEGKGFSFDCINQTNGFQPLWLYLLIPLISLLKNYPELTIRIVFLIQIILLTVSAFIFYFLQSKFFNKKILLPCGIIFIVFVFFKAINGMETALLIFMLSLLYFYCVKYKILFEHSCKREFILGLILGLVLLTRLDMIFLAIAIGIFCLFNIYLKKTYRKENLIKLVLIGSGAAIIVTPYLMYNYFTFGNIIPISGYLKLSFPLVTLEDKFIAILQYREILFVFSAFIYFVWFLFNLKKFKKHSTDKKIFYFCMGIMSLGIIQLFIYTIFFMNWIIFLWYFISYSMFASFVICLPLNYILKLKKKFFSDILFTSITLLLVLYGSYKIYILYEKNYYLTGNNWNIETYKAAQWVKTNTNKNDLFAMKDAGHFSFFSERNVINLDGLVNNFEYQEVIKNKNLNGYFKKNKVKYLVQHAIWNREDVTYGNYDTLQIKYISHEYSSESDPIILNKKDEVYRSAPYYDGDYNVAFIIWKF